MRAETQIPPRPECPEPGRWSAPDDWATETEVTRLLAELVRALKPDLVVETGTYHGHTARAIGEALRAVGRGRLVTLEMDPGRAALAASACEGLPVEVRCMSSLAYTPDQPIDLLFLDSEFTQRIPECVAMAPWASARCVVALHDAAIDYYPGAGEMQRAVQAVVAQGLVAPWLVLPTPRGLGLTRYVT